LLRHINHHNLRRAVSSSCELGITAFVVFGLGVIVFICVIARGYREWRASGDISGWTQVKGYMLLVGISWLLALALVFYRQC
jgi:multisubunit Na+/H+ antiporter MnhB subunit